MSNTMPNPCFLNPLQISSLKQIPHQTPPAEHPLLVAMRRNNEELGGLRIIC